MARKAKLVDGPSTTTLSMRLLRTGKTVDDAFRANSDFNEEATRLRTH